MKWPLLAALIFTTPVLATQALAQATAQPPPAAGAVGPATALTPAPDDRAKQWLGLIDDQNYSDAYKQMGQAAQGHASDSTWAGKIRSAREPMGAMASRTIKDIKLSHTLSGMRDGQYATVRFDTSFARKAAVVETVVLTSDKGAWSVIDYSVN